MGAQAGRVGQSRAGHGGGYRGNRGGAERARSATGVNTAAAAHGGQLSATSCLC